jgi:hypothetical protein
LAIGTVGRYVTNTAAVAVTRQANDQAMAVAHSAITISGLVDGSQWDWASDNKGDKARMQEKVHASETASAKPADDEQVAFGANQKVDKEAYHEAHRTANYVTH